MEHGIVQGLVVMGGAGPLARGRGQWEPPGADRSRSTQRFWPIHSRMTSAKWMSSGPGLMGVWQLPGLSAQPHETPGMSELHIRWSATGSMLRELPRG